MNLNKKKQGEWFLYNLLYILSYINILTSPPYLIPIVLVLLLMLKRLFLSAFWIENEQGRVIYDSNGMSEITDDFKSAGGGTGITGSAARLLK